MQASPTLYHVHDPMCSWCWGYRKTWDEVRAALPASVNIVNVVGGLAPDSDQPMPPEQQELIAGYWRAVADKTGASFNFDFWQNCEPLRSTYPACRAVLAAKKQGAEQTMIDAIQHAYYLQARNPSNRDILIALAVEIGLEENMFAEDLCGDVIQSELEKDFELRRSINVYSFPSLVLLIGHTATALAIDYNDSSSTLGAIDRLLA